MVLPGSSSRAHSGRTTSTRLTATVYQVNTRSVRARGCVQWFSQVQFAAVTFRGETRVVMVVPRSNAQQSYKSHSKLRQVSRNLDFPCHARGGPAFRGVTRLRLGWPFSSMPLRDRATSRNYSGRCAGVGIVVTNVAHACRGLTFPPPTPRWRVERKLTIPRSGCGFRFRHWKTCSSLRKGSVLRERRQRELGCAVALSRWPSRRWCWASAPW